MARARDDRYVTDAQGRALSGAQVYWCTQPASTANDPPSPLATIYDSISGGTPETQPVLTDGFGHAYAYLDDSVLYTVVIWHPLFGYNPVVLPDQSIGGGSGGGSGLTPFAGTPLGIIDGTNRVFTLTNGGTPIPDVTPVQIAAWLNFPLIPGLGFSVSGNIITYANAPQPASSSGAADTIFAQGFY